MKTRRRKKRRPELVVEESARVPGRCTHFGTCGGCAYQDVDYPAQLAAQEVLLRDLLAPLGDLEVDPILGCDNPWHYRNKMDFTFGNRRWLEDGEASGDGDGFALGMHPRERYDKVMDVRQCDIAFEEAAPIVVSVRDAARDLGLDAWDVKAHRGLLRHLVLRKAVATGEILAQLVTTEEAAEAVSPLVERTLARHPEITTLVQTINPGVALVATGVEERTHHGSGRIHEELAGLRYSISAASFFQTNTAQAERLVELVLARSGAAAGAKIFDLYCGCGTFALALARAGADVVGFELVEAAIQDARENARVNGLDAVRFVSGDLKETLAADRLDPMELATPEVCVVDPPRAGMHHSALASLRRLRPGRIVYVSCNPKNAVRDMIPLRADGYRIVRVQPVDLFPHTPHLECVFTLNLA